MKKRKIIYIILILCFLFLGTFAAYYILEQLKDTPLTLSVLDDQTITLEYGIDTPPTVTASYRDSQFSKENIYVDVTIEGEVDLSTLGTYVVTYTASNENETVSATHTYVIQDYTAPTITLYGGEFGYYSPGYTYIEAGFSASDNYDGDITDRVIRTETPTSVTYSVTDSFGNECSVTRNLICQDIVAPGLYLNGGDFLLIEKGSTFTDPGCLAFDDVNGDISANIMVTGSIDTNKYGKQYLTYTVADYSGNLSQIQRTVVVQEFTPPTLTLTGSKVFMLAGEAYVDPGYLAVDDVDGDVTANVTLSNTLDTNTPGIYTLTYTAIDSSLNTTSLTRTVYVCSPQSEELRINPTDKVVYLTFDDGPGPYTEQLLNTLDKYNIDVTFFVTNQNTAYQDMIGDAYFRGHTIALHTYSHSFPKVYASEEAYYNDLFSISAIVEQQTGIKPIIIRFPGGSSNSISRRYSKGIMTRLSQSVLERGYLYYDWNVDSNDAGGARTSEEVVTNVITGMQNNATSIVLQHDTKLYSVEAVEEIICWGMLNGYTFLPITESTPMYHHDVVN